MALMKVATPRYPSFLDRFMEGDWMDWMNANYSPTNTTLPAVNIKEDDDKFEVELAAPGMTKDDFDINLHNSQLTVSSERKEEHKEDEDEENYARREFSYQAFTRTFTIPQNIVDAEKIDAKYDDGILRIVLPKLETAKPKPARKIKIM